MWTNPYKRAAVFVFLGITLGLSGPMASVRAEKLYKVTRPDGSVIYQDHKPGKATDGTVELKDIDPDANVISAEEGSGGNQNPNSSAGTDPTGPKPGQQGGNQAIPAAGLSPEELAAAAAAAAASAGTPAPPTAFSGSGASTGGGAPTAVGGGF